MNNNQNTTNDQQQNHEQELIETLCHLIDDYNTIINNPMMKEFLCRENIIPNLNYLEENFKSTKDENPKEKIFQCKKLIMHLSDLAMLLGKKLSVLNDPNNFQSSYPDKDFTFYSCIDGVKEEVKLLNVKDHEDMTELNRDIDAVKFRIIKEDPTYLEFFGITTQKNQQTLTS